MLWHGRGCPDGVVTRRPPTRGEGGQVDDSEACESNRIAHDWASVLLGWLVANAEVFYADGIRYINQAKVIDQRCPGSAVCFDRSITRSTLSPSSATPD